MAAVGLFFAPLAPLVAVACAVVFWLSSWVYKYQLMFVFVSKTESGGVSTALCIVSVFRLIFVVAYVECRHQPSPGRCRPHAVHHDPK